jgi:hypothetical protein
MLLAFPCYWSSLPLGAFPGLLAFSAFVGNPCCCKHPLLMRASLLLMTARPYVTVFPEFAVDPAFDYIPDVALIPAVSEILVIASLFGCFLPGSNSNRNFHRFNLI